MTLDRGTARVWVVDVDGGAARAIARGSNPEWLDDTRLVLTLFEESGDDYRTFSGVVAYDGRGLRKVADAARRPTWRQLRDRRRAAGWSPDRRWQAVGRRDGNGRTWIEIRTADGKPVGPTQRPRGGGFVRETNPAWSPDGREVAFVRVCCGPPGNGVHVLDRSGRRRRVAPFGSRVTWSPDGRRLAIQVAPQFWDGSPPGAMYVVNADGTGLRRVSPDD